MLLPRATVVVEIRVKQRLRKWRPKNSDREVLRKNDLQSSYYIQPIIYDYTLFFCNVRLSISDAPNFSELTARLSHYYLLGSSDCGGPLLCTTALPPLASDNGCNAVPLLRRVADGWCAVMLRHSPALAGRPTETVLTF